MDDYLGLYDVKLKRIHEGITTPNGCITIDKDIPILDKATLESCSNERAFLIEVCESFLSDVPERVQSLETALKQADVKVIAETAHALKSLSGCVGAMRLFQLCQAIEASARASGKLAAEPVSTQIATEYEHIQIAIQTYRNTD